jgi:hypothetical protein
MLVAPASAPLSFRVPRTSPDHPTPEHLCRRGGAPMVRVWSLDDEPGSGSLFGHSAARKSPEHGREMEPFDIYPVDILQTPDSGQRFTWSDHSQEPCSLYQLPSKEGSEIEGS